MYEQAVVKGACCFFLIDSLLYVRRFYWLPKHLCDPLSNSCGSISDAAQGAPRAANRSAAITATINLKTCSVYS